MCGITVSHRVVYKTGLYKKLYMLGCIQFSIVGVLVLKGLRFGHFCSMAVLQALRL